MKNKPDCRWNVPNLTTSFHAPLAATCRNGGASSENQNRPVLYKTPFSFRTMNYGAKIIYSLLSIDVLAQISIALASDISFQRFHLGRDWSFGGDTSQSSQAKFVVERVAMSVRYHVIRSEDYRLLLETADFTGQMTKQSILDLPQANWNIQSAYWIPDSRCIKFISWSSNFILFVSLDVETAQVNVVTRFEQPGINQVSPSDWIEDTGCSVLISFVTDDSVNQTIGIFLDNQWQLKQPLNLSLDISLQHNWIQPGTTSSFVLTRNGAVLEINFESLYVSQLSIKCPEEHSLGQLSWNSNGQLLLVCINTQSESILLFNFENSNQTMIETDGEYFGNNRLFMKFKSNDQLLLTARQENTLNLTQLLIFNEAMSLERAINIGSVSSVDGISMDFAADNQLLMAMNVTDSSNSFLCRQNGLCILLFNFDTASRIGAARSYAPATPTIDPINPAAGTDEKNTIFTNTVILSACIVFSMVLVAVAFIHYNVSQSRKKQSKLKQVKTVASLTDENDRAMAEWCETFVNTERELSIPGYLQIDVNVCCRPKKTVMTSEKTQVILASILSKQIIESVKLNECIMKVLNGVDQHTFLQEVAVMAYFRDNEHFAKIIGFSMEEKVICMKYYRLGSLHQWIHKKGRSQVPTYTVDCVHFFSLDIGRGLLAMHEAGFIHYDVKPQNIFLDTRNVDGVVEVYAVLADFGGTFVIDSPSLLVTALQVVEKKEATLRYAPPEVVKRFLHMVSGARNWSSEQAKAVDVYSYGMILFELLAKEEPYDDCETIQSLMDTIVGRIRPKISGKIMEQIGKNSILTAIHQLMLQCTAFESLNRPKMLAIVDQLERLNAVQIAATDNE